MSFTEKVTEFATATLNATLKAVCDKYELNYDEVVAFVGSQGVAPAVVPAVVKPKRAPAKKAPAKTKASEASTKSSKEDDDEKDEPSELTLERVLNAKVAELKVFCKSRGLAVSGKKDELVSRLTSYIKNGGGTKEEGDPKEVKKEPKTLVQAVIEKIKEANAPVIKIRKNEFGNYEDPVSKIVMKDNVAIGLQRSDGSVGELTQEEIELCKARRWQYKTPSNLDAEIPSASGATKHEESDLDIQEESDSSIEESETESDVD
jgi:hypothetical protein